MICTSLPLVIFTKFRVIQEIRAMYLHTAAAATISSGSLRINMNLSVFRPDYYYFENFNILYGKVCVCVGDYLPWRASYNSITKIRNRH